MATTVKAKDNIVPLPGATSSPVSRKRRNKWLQPGPLIAFLIGLFVLYSFGVQVVQMQQNVQTMKSIQKQIDALEDQNSGLRKDIKRLKTNAYIERQAREKLGLVKPGEKMIVETEPKP